MRTPMVIADRWTQTFAISQPAPEEARPRLLGVVNAPLQWGGATWGAYIWDDVVNATPRHRREIFLHELFHGVQPKLGLGAATLATEHLDAADGRYWLRLEWRALARALQESEGQRNLAVRDALAFRQARRMLYPASVDGERGQEITEGLAAYTGTVLAAPSAAEAIASAVENLTVVETGESFVRTFAYALFESLRVRLACVAKWCALAPESRAVPSSRELTVGAHAAPPPRHP